MMFCNTKGVFILPKSESICEMNAGTGWAEVNSYIASLADLYAHATEALPKCVAIFGCGSTGKSALSTLRNWGAQSCFFVDNDPARQGTRVDGVDVVPPAKAIEMAPEMVFIAARAVSAIRRQLEQMRLPYISFDAYCVMRHLERIGAVRDNLLRDTRSRVVFDAVLKSMLTGCTSYCAEVMEGAQYFALPQFAGNCYEHFVDAGAFVGDTVERFLWTTNGAFARIYAFEPGRRPFEALCTRMKRLRAEWALTEESVVCIPAGLGESCKEMGWIAEAGGLLQGATCTASLISDEVVQVYSLDAYLEGRPATFIKADVEGVEIELLRGAAATIRRFCPKLAISIYHSPEDMFAVAEYLKALVPEYNIAIRQHAPVRMETVLYAWVDE
jgi:FkbM family methyltransferase